jgi:DNA-binding CsgD family transcriptional regulator
MENISPDMVVRPDYRLTARERDVLTMAAHGLNRVQIAGRLGLRPSTIGSHLKRIYRKLGVHNRTAAVAICLRQGLANDTAQAKPLVFGVGFNSCPNCGANFQGSVLPVPILGV